MRAYEHTIEVSRRMDECVSIIHNGDEHIGSNAVDEKLQIDVVDRVAEDDNCYWVTTGDMCELILYGDPRFEHNAVPKWFTFSMMSDPAKYQVLRYNDIYGRIADKCLATVEGNHEFSMAKHFSRDIYRELNDTLGIPQERRLGTGGFLRLRFMSNGKCIWRPTFYLHHGVSGGRSKSAILLELEKLPKAYEADFYCVGHAHKRVAAQDERILMDSATGRITRRKVFYSATGSYMSGVTEDSRGHYPERRGMYPQGIGPNEFHLYPNRKIARLII